jgi:4-amino-4-deoxy-L-arabinose transferase-like glycosyltransferase
MNDRVNVTLLVIITIVILSIFSSISKELLWDETVYLANARTHTTGSEFSEDFRYPLLEWIIALIWLMTGENIIIVKTIMIVLSGLTIGISYLICRKYFDSKESTIISVLILLSPLIINWGNKIYTDAPALFLTVVSFYLMQCGLSTSSNKKIDENTIFLLAGVFSGLAFLMRFTVGLFPLAVFIYLSIKKRYKPLILFTLGVIISITPWVIYNQVNYNNPIWDLGAQFDAIEQWTKAESWTIQIFNILKSLNFIILILFIIGTVKTINIFDKGKKHNNEAGSVIALIYVWLCLIYYVFIAKIKEARYIISFLPFVFIIAFLGLRSLKNKITKRGCTVLTIIILILSAIAFINESVKIYEYEKCDMEKQIMQSMDFFYKDADPPGVYTSNYSIYILSNVWPWYGYYLNARVKSLWSSNLTYLNNIYQSQYIVYDSVVSYIPEGYFNQEGIVLEKILSNQCSDEKIYIYKVTKYQAVEPLDIKPRAGPFGQE